MKPDHQPEAARFRRRHITSVPTPDATTLLSLIPRPTEACFLLAFFALIQTSAGVGTRYPAIFLRGPGGVFQISRIFHVDVSLTASQQLALTIAPGLEPGLLTDAVTPSGLFPLPIGGLYVPPGFVLSFGFLGDQFGGDGITEGYAQFSIEGPQ